jgi:uncharacterized lipoprotein
MRAIVSLALAASLLAGVSACATTEDVVAFNYAAQDSAPVAGAQNIRVTVTAADARTTNRGRISTKINGYGMEMAAIRSEQEVAEIVRDAVGKELAERGYQIATGGPQVNAAVETFYSDFNTGMLAGKAKGDVAMTVTVADPGGRQLYSRRVAGTHTKAIQMASGKNAGETLTLALRQAISELFSDPAFTAALAGSGPAAAAR